MRKRYFSLLLAFVILLGFLSQGGYLSGEAREGKSAISLIADWGQGCSWCCVEYRNGSLAGCRTINEGPNSCDSDAPAGDQRATYVPASADGSGPNEPDAIVDCELCGCGDGYTCGSDGSCDACERECDDPNYCNAGEDCLEPDWCGTATCACDAVACANRPAEYGEWGTCTNGRQIRAVTRFGCAADRCQPQLSTERRAC